MAIMTGAVIDVFFALALALRSLPLAVPTYAKTLAESASLRRLYMRAIHSSIAAIRSDVSCCSFAYLAA